MGSRFRGWPRQPLFIAAGFVVALSGCLREDPQVQMLRAELQRAQMELVSAKKESQVNRLTSTQQQALARFPELDRENVELKQKLRLAEEELKQVKGSAFRVMGEDELYLSLDRASRPFREKIKTDYKIEGVTFRDWVTPNLDGYPYRCTADLEIIRLSDNQPMEMAIPLKANEQAEWLFPEWQELVSLVRPRGQSGPPVERATSFPNLARQPSLPVPSEPAPSMPAARVPPPPESRAAAAPAVPAGVGKVVGERKIKW